MRETGRSFDHSLQALFLLAIFACGSATFFKPFNVSFDHSALIVDGKRRMLISAGVHYPRATPDMWPGIIAKSKEAGVDVIQTYVFWNGHEPTRGQYYFEDRFDLVKFVKLVGASGLYFHLRIGPYVCAEWNFGGFPVWLRDIPGIEFRTNNVQFKAEMQRFVEKIVSMMMQEMLFSWQGGPIILLQIENEYGDVEGHYGQNGHDYIQWAAQMAVELGANVPWVMCKQPDAPEYVIDSCNAYYCDGFKPNSYKKPTFWTEDWTGWCASWGGGIAHRPVEDNAFAVARFFERGGSFHNYYMFFGGTNFGRTAGGLQITSYDYDAPIDEYGQLRQPKWGHLKDLHAAIKLCEPALVAVDDQPQFAKLGPKQEAHIYSSRKVDIHASSLDNVSFCSAFLANIDDHRSRSVKFLGQYYILPPWSVSILPDCRHVAFNTAKVGYQYSLRTFPSGSLIQNSTDLSCYLLVSNNWKSFKEPIGAWSNTTFTAEGILEHLNVTKDTTDYLWYITRVNISMEDISSWEGKASIKIGSIRDVVHVFINGILAGSQVGHWVPVDLPIHLVAGVNEIAILSETVGLQNNGGFLEKDGAGLKGDISLTAGDKKEINISASLWEYQIGLKGEHLKIYSIEDNESVRWKNLLPASIQTPFVWYETLFDAPAGINPLAIDLGSMGKGQAWINGHGIGRYWSIEAPKTGCAKTCSYRGTFNENKCVTNCGEPTQRWYHIPRSWLQASHNLLVMFEETGGNPLKISLKEHASKTICSTITESHTPPLHIWFQLDYQTANFSYSSTPPEMVLQCDPGQIMSEVTFASFGNPKGECLQYSLGSCHASNSLTVVSNECIGRNNCKINVSTGTFHEDPCPTVAKSLAVEATCVSSLIDIAL